MKEENNKNIVMITIEDIRKYCEVGEDCELEFKDGQGGFPSKEFWRSYSAFANTNGGLIIIGVVEEKKQKKTPYCRTEPRAI